MAALKTGRVLFALLVATAAGQLGGSCGGGSGGGGQRSVIRIESPDVRCVAQSSQFPPGFDFVPGRDDLVWSADFSPPTLLPLDVSVVPPRVPDGLSPLVIPFDSDGDGLDETVLAPVPDDVEIPRADLGFVTASSYEEVIFFDPMTGQLREFEVSVPAGFAKSDNPLLPDPGTSALRTALSTFACVRPPPGARDSHGNPVSQSVPESGFCDPSTPSYLASFTAGAALAGNQLFVPTSNLGGGAGSDHPQFLPGSVLVYDIDLETSPPRVSPKPDTPVLITTHFNPTHVTAFERDGRSFVLVTNSGSLGIEADDPDTQEIEGAGIALTDGAIDVIDGESLVVIATIPLGRSGPSFDRLAIDPTGSVAATGSTVARYLLAVDLRDLENLPPSPPVPLVLDGSTGPDAVIFDANEPFLIPDRPRGATPASCPGYTAGVAWNDAGTRLYVSDFCDGTMGVVLADLEPPLPQPAPVGRFRFGQLVNLTEPLRSDTLGLPRQPGALEVRPGRPGVDFEGPDVFFVVGDPGLLCGIEAES